MPQWWYNYHWSPKIALVLGNYIVNQVGNLCRGHPDKRIPHFEASCSCVQKKVHAKKKYVSDCIFKKFWDISWNFPAGFHHHVGLHHINIQLDIYIYISWGFWFWSSFCWESTIPNGVPGEDVMIFMETTITVGVLAGNGGVLLLDNCETPTLMVEHGKHQFCFDNQRKHQFCEIVHSWKLWTMDDNGIFLYLILFVSVRLPFEVRWSVFGRLIADGPWSYLHPQFNCLYQCLAGSSVHVAFGLSWQTWNTISHRIHVCYIW